jgi:5-methylcytosine-specific restriction endonuclease McrA
MATDVLRRCRACQQEFPQTSEFFVTVRKKRAGLSEWIGFARECRVCRNKRFRPYYEKNRESLIARATESTKKRRERPEIREQERIWAREHKRKVLADPVAREVHRTRWRNFHAQRLQIEGSHTAEDVARILERQGFVCFWCSADLSGGKHQMDHYVPLARGGSNWPDNLVCSCGPCNQSKGNMLPDEFLSYREKMRRK